MKKRRSIRIKIFVIIIGILIPTNMVTVFICNDLLNNMKQDILKNQENEMKMFASQISARLEISENYIYSTLNDERWIGMRYPQGSKEYELAKSNLWVEISDQTHFLSISDVIYCYVDKTSESFTVKNNNKISYTDNQQIRNWVKNYNILNKWNLHLIGEKSYLTISKTNTNFTLGIVVKKETILKEWTTSSTREIDIVKAGTEIEKPGYYILRTNFLNSSLELVCYTPKQSINNEIPFRYYIMLSALIIVSFIAAMVFILIERIVERPLKNMKNTITEIENGNMEYRVSKYDNSKEFYAIQKAFNKLMDKIYDLKIQTYEMEIENQKTQLLNLQLQINPHFLLNSLNTVYGLSEVEDYKNIQKFTLNLVKYLRYSLKNTDKLVKLGQELDFITSYMEIQKIRFPNRFYVVYNVEEELMDEPIPPLLIENFVENSAKYSPNDKLTEILVIVKKQEGFLNISICDDGNGISEEILQNINAGNQIEDEEGSHVGIWNCQRRLRLFYGDQAKFSISSMEGQGTQVWMEIPSRRS